MAQAQQGHTVRVHYTGTLQDGSIFDSSETAQEESCGCDCSSGSCGSSQDCGSEPLEFTLGAGMVIPGFENAVIGLSVGESITVTIPSDEAYGPYQEAMTAIVDRVDIQGDVEPIPGQHLEVMLQDGASMPVLIREVTETTVTIDGNHPLAGENLTFTIRLVEIL